MTLSTDLFVHAVSSVVFCSVQIWLVLMPYIQRHRIHKFWGDTKTLIDQVSRISNDKSRLLKCMRKLQRRNALIVSLILLIFVAIIVTALVAEGELFNRFKKIKVSPFKRVVCVFAVVSWRCFNILHGGMCLWLVTLVDIYAVCYSEIASILEEIAQTDGDDGLLRSNSRLRACINFYDRVGDGIRAFEKLYGNVIFWDLFMSGGMALLYAHLAVRCIMLNVFSLLPSYGVILSLCLIRTYAICSAVSKANVNVQNVGMHAASICSKGVVFNQEDVLFEQVISINCCTTGSLFVQDGLQLAAPDVGLESNFRSPKNKSMELLFCE